MKIEEKMLVLNVGFNNYRIPQHMVEGLDIYINHRIKQGSFLHAVLCNNLKEACLCADNKNLANLPAYINFLYNYAPINCWGSPEKVAAWLKGGAE